MRSRDAALPAGGGAARVRRTCRSSFAWVIGLATLLLGGPAVAPATAQEALIADVQSSEMDGYGRIIITFRDQSLLPTYDARVSSGVLRITFPEPVDMKVPEPLSSTLSTYVSVARQDPDGSGLRLALKSDLRINTMEAGEKLFVDLLPASWSGLPPGLPDEVVRDLAQRAEEAMRKLRELKQAAIENRTLPGVTLRIGEHPTFTRLVFQWTVPFDSQFVRDSDMVKVLFNHPVDLDLSDLKAHLPAGIVDATEFKADEKLNFLMRVNPDVDIRAFREGDTYVVDVVHPVVGPADPKLSGIDAALADDTPPTASEQISAPGIDAPRTPSVADSPEIAATPEAATDKSTAPMPVPAEAPAPVAAGVVEADVEQAATSAREQSQPPAAEMAAAEEGAEGTVADPAKPRTIPPAEPAKAAPADGPVASAERASAAPSPSVADAPATSKDDISQLIAANTFSAAATPAPPATLPDARPNPELVSDAQFSAIRNFVSVEARRIGDTVRIVFPFLEPVSSAVFRRGSVLWLVFDSDVPIDLGAARTALVEAAKAIEVFEHGDWQVIRIVLSDRVLTTVGSDGATWVLTIGEMILEPSRPLEVQRIRRDDGEPILRVAFGEPVAVRTISDPAVGDDIKVVTGFGPARGLIKAQSFVDLNTLSSAQGMAIVPLVDDLDISFDEDDVLIQRANGLAISSSDLNVGTGLRTKVDIPKKPQTQADLASLVAANTTEYVRELRRREMELAALPAEKRGPARLEFAKFQVANYFAPEALGLLALVARDNPAIVNDPVFNLTSGAANVLAARPKDALKHLELPALADSADAAVWRMMADTALRKWTEARLAISKGQGVIGKYPPAFQAEFNLDGAHALVEVNDFGSATGFLAELDPTTLTRPQAARYDVLRGRVADAAGRSEEALRAFDIVARSADRPRSAEATYRALRIRYRDGGIDAAEAKRRLEGLTTVWRGDLTELQALRFLAQINAENGNYREAFEAMRAAVEADPSASTTRLLQEEMNAVFSSLFLDGKADELEPIDALALYYDFRELTPIGSNGDEMVRRLADRLVSVDLLGQAAELLQYQVDNRLKGAARAQIAADLGLVYLLDRKPEKSLAVLNRTRQAQLPRTLDRQRRIVEARALTDTGRSDLAMELISNLRGPEVDRLRADTLWEAERWLEAGEQLERMHGVRWSDTIPLEDQERLDILRAAIAYSFAKDQLGLDRLRSKYVAKMADSPSGAAFDIVTRPIDAKGVEFMSVAREIAAVDTLESFLAEYRRHYLNPTQPSDLPVGMADAPTSPS